MPSLYVTEPGAVVRLSGSGLQVTISTTSPVSTKTVLKVGTHQVETVSLVGRVHITADALKLCLEQGVGVAWGNDIPPLHASRQ